MQLDTQSAHIYIYIYMHAVLADDDSEIRLNPKEFTVWPPALSVLIDSFHCHTELADQPVIFASKCNRGC